MRLLAGRRRVLFLPLAYLVLVVLLFDPKLDTGGDSAVYLILARSLAAGTGYVDGYLPGAPPHTQFPPGFPLLLSLPARAGPGADVLLAKLLVALAGAGAVGLIGLVYSDVLRERAPLAGAFLVSVPVLAAAGSRVLTEVPFLLVSMAAIYCLQRDDDEPGRLGWAGLALAGAGLLLRTAGVALVLGVALHLALRRRFVQLGVLAMLFLAFFVPWQARGAAVGSGGGYIAQFLARDPYVPEFGRVGAADLAARGGKNVLSYVFNILPRGLLPILPRGVLAGGAGLLLVALAAAGFRTRVRRPSVLETYTLFGVLGLLAWPEVWADERFLLPVAPLIVLYVLLGVEWLGTRLGRRRLVPVFALALVVLNVAALARQAVASVGANAAFLGGDRYAGYGPGWRSYFEACDWIRGNVPRAAVVLARKPEFVYLRTGNRSFRYPFTNDRSLVLEAVDRSDYILFDNFEWTRTTRYFLNPVLQDHPDRFRFVHETAFPTFFVLEVVKPGVPVDTAGAGP